MKIFDWLLPEQHAIAILKKDHDTIKDLFERFEKAERPAGRERLIDQALMELKIHAVLEEEIFYPCVRRHVGSELMNEAVEEHHIAKVLIAELDRPDHGGGHRDAKFKVLAESVRHHIKEEEEEMLPKARETEIDFEQLGQLMLERKKQLLSEGIPADAEHTMVARAANSRSDTASMHKRGNTMAKKASSSSKSKGKAKIKKVMKEHKQGTLKSGSGKKVKSRKQAVAIALSEARKSGAKIPKKK